MKSLSKVVFIGGKTSPPSRGAWIEIRILAQRGVHQLTSPPSRGAWIEISLVSRVMDTSCRRPPRGGRGLKCHNSTSLEVVDGVAPLAGGVD